MDVDRTRACPALSNAIRPVRPNWLAGSITRIASWIRVETLGALACALVLGVATPDAASAARVEDPKLRFIDHEGETRSLSRSELRALCPEEEVDVTDPYHGRPMRYLALPLRCVLDAGFAKTGGAAGQAARGMLLRALDGYTRPVAGRDLLEDGAFVAFGEPDLMQGDDDTPRFAKIDRRGIDPGPFYMVWTGATQNDPHVHPWPYQLATIEVAPFAEAFPHTVPKGLAESDPAWGGYTIFQRACASCHAINGEGGKVGPELNVPKSIVEYRPIEQIKGYIRNPQATRYTSMPPHPDLSEADLDALIAYFSAMSERKSDPGRRDES